MSIVDGGGTPWVRWQQQQQNLQELSTSPKAGSCPVLPSAIPHGSWQLWLSAMLYFLIGLAALVGLVQALRVNRRYYFRCSFLTASVLLCLLRGVQTLYYWKELERHMFVCYLLDLFIPIYLQYWLYSLLVLFVWRCILVIHDHEVWVNRFLYPVYHSVQFLLLLLCFTTSFELGRKWDSADRGDWDRQPALYVAFLYFVLMCFGVYFSHRAFKLIEMATTSIYSKRKLRWIGALMCMYLLLFFLRCVWNATYYLGHNPVQNWINRRYDACDQSALASTYLVFYLIFEMVPTAVVVYIVTLHIKPRSTSGSPLHDKASGGKSYQSTDENHHRHFNGNSNNNNNNPNNNNSSSSRHASSDDFVDVMI